MKRTLLAGRREVLFEHQLQHIRQGLQQTPGAYPVGTVAQLEKPRTYAPRGPCRPRSVSSTPITTAILTRTDFDQQGQFHLLTLLDGHAHQVGVKSSSFGPQVRRNDRPEITRPAAGPGQGGDGYADFALGGNDLGGVASARPRPAASSGEIFNRAPGCDRQGAAGVMGGVGTECLQGLTHHQGQGRRQGRLMSVSIRHERAADRHLEIGQGALSFGAKPGPTAASSEPVPGRCPWGCHISWPKAILDADLVIICQSGRTPIYMEGPYSTAPIAGAADKKCLPARRAWPLAKLPETVGRCPS